MTLVGRPNAGKSTLINAVVGHKVAITSNTAQTTRHRFRAIVTREDMQMNFIVDTQGLHKPHDALGEELNTSAIMAMEDVDVIAFLVDASKPIGRGDEWVAAQVRAVRHARKILVITKADLVDKDVIISQLEAARALGRWDDEVVLSSKSGFNVDGFEHAVSCWLPEGPKWFPDDMDTDQPFEVLVAEFIREKILRSFRDEVPHSIGVIADQIEYERRKDMYKIYAVVYVERDSQKGIIIGKGGSAIKQIGIEARQDLEQLLGCKVFLDLQVKVKKNWRQRPEPDSPLRIRGGHLAIAKFCTWCGAPLGARCALLQRSGGRILETVTVDGSKAVEASDALRGFGIVDGKELPADATLRLDRDSVVVPTDNEQKRFSLDSAKKRRNVAFIVIGIIIAVLLVVVVVLGTMYMNSGFGRN